jgi:hypothetical protein
VTPGQREVLMRHKHAWRTYVIRVWVPRHAHAFAQEPFVVCRCGVQSWYLEAITAVTSGVSYSPKAVVNP